MMKEETTYHIPVLLMPSVDAMNIRPDGTYVDVTFGGGGHSREILSRLEDGGRLLSFDQDEDAERNIVNNPHFTFVRSNFRYLHNFLRYHGIEKVDAILADLGVSSHHFDDSERGFSFRFDGALDMRMNKRAGLTAADIVNTYEEEKLADIFYLYGELKNSRKLASVIVKARATQRIATIGEFLEIVKPLFGREREKKELAKVFQALRIEVNQEMEALKEMLYAATEALKPGGRLVVITYHSLEDRMVKNIMKTGNVEGKAEKDFFGNVLTPFRLVNNKVIVPDEEEIERNPRSRSAKLRIAERIMNDYPSNHTLSRCRCGDVYESYRYVRRRDRRGSTGRCIVLSAGTSVYKRPDRICSEAWIRCKSTSEYSGKCSGSFILTRGMSFCAEMRVCDGAVPEGKTGSLSSRRGTEIQMLPCGKCRKGGEVDGGKRKDRLIKAGIQSIPGRQKPFRKTR